MKITPKNDNMMNGMPNKAAKSRCTREKPGQHLHMSH